MNLCANQFQQYNHQVPEACDQRHQGHIKQVLQDLILRRHQSNSTTWRRSSAPTAAKTLDGSRVILVVESRGFPMGQRPASKTQTKTMTQLPADSFHLLLSLQLIDPLLAAELLIPQSPYQLLRALLEIYQEKLQLDLSCPVAPTPFSLRD